MHIAFQYFQNIIELISKVNSKGVFYMLSAQGTDSTAFKKHIFSVHCFQILKAEITVITRLNCLNSSAKASQVFIPDSHFKINTFQLINSPVYKAYIQVLGRTIAITKKMNRTQNLYCRLLKHTKYLGTWVTAYNTNLFAILCQKSEAPHSEFVLKPKFENHNLYPILHFVV